ncbi:hypothetical protein [Streptomyces sp. NPDC015130]|uniref:hypothetical protein n=1 Tax=Streptomyces sp. NPDC015130 TaxID=3364940 RepID=UPI00370077D3
MRRPTQHPARTPRDAWSHPYTGIQALGVFYNDGGDPTDPPTGGAPAAPKPTAPAAPAPQVSMSQDDLTALAAREKSQGERAGARKALGDLAAKLGFSSIDDAETFVAAARQAQQDALTDEQKRTAELDRREQDLAARELSAAKAQRDADRRSALAGLGATGDDLTDALALLQVGLTDDADAQALTAAAEALKARRPELFGTSQTPATPPLPPAPGGAPAGTPPARPSGGEKPGSRGLEMARLRGHRTAA